MPIHVTLCHDHGGWLPLFLSGTGPTRPSDWPMLSAALLRRLEAYNDWGVGPAPEDPAEERREEQRWEAEIPALLTSLRAELGDEYVVTF